MQVRADKHYRGKADNYARLQIEISGLLYLVVPIDADEDAVCIGLFSGLCPLLEQCWICTDPEDFSITKAIYRSMVKMCFLWVARCACDAIQDATPEELFWRSTSPWVIDRRWPSARAVKEIEIPGIVQVPGRIIMDLRGRLPEEPEHLTVQELDFFLRGGISAGPWKHFTEMEIRMPSLPETDPLDTRRNLIDAWQKSVVEMSDFSFHEVPDDE